MSFRDQISNMTLHEDSLGVEEMADVLLLEAASLLTRDEDDDPEPALTERDFVARVRRIWQQHMLNLELNKAADRAGAVVLKADDPQVCGFYHPSDIYTLRKPLVLIKTTDGGFPVTVRRTGEADVVCTTLGRLVKGLSFIKQRQTPRKKA